MYLGWVGDGVGVGVGVRVRVWVRVWVLVRVHVRGRLRVGVGPGLDGGLVQLDQCVHRAVAYLEGGHVRQEVVAWLE